jgi:hypothetical protein
MGIGCYFKVFSSFHNPFFYKYDKSKLFVILFFVVKQQKEIFRFLLYIYYKNDSR